MKLNNNEKKINQYNNVLNKIRICYEENNNHCQHLIVIKLAMQNKRKSIFDFKFI